MAKIFFHHFLTFVAVKTAAVMTLAITLALPMKVRTIIRAYLHIAGFTGPRGVAGTCAFDAHSMAGTVNVGISGNDDICTRHIIKSILLLASKYHYWRSLTTSESKCTCFRALFTRLNNKCLPVLISLLQNDLCWRQSHVLIRFNIWR